MAVAVGEIIAEARGMHPAFDRQRNPQPVLLVALSRLHRELFRKVARQAAETVSMWTDDISLPLADFAAGHTLADPFIRLLGARITPIGHTLHGPLRIVPTHQQYSPALWPAVREELGVIYLLGQAEEWTQYASFAVRYIPQPLAFDDAADEIMLDDDAAPALVASLKHFMAYRTPDMPGARPIDVRACLEEKLEAEGAYLDGLSARKVVVAQIPAVW